MAKTIYDITTDKVLELMEKGIVPWKQTWEKSLPINYISKKPYNGSNLFFLYCVCQLDGYTVPYFASYKQIKDLGGQVRKGQRGYPVYFSMPKTVIDEAKSKKTGKDEEKVFWITRYYTVFNLEQADGIEYKHEKQEVDTLVEAKSIVDNYKNKPKIEHGLFNPCYLPQTDIVRMPSLNKFNTQEAYYATLFHELIHSTGHGSRLKRDMTGEFKSESYSKEELIAEFGAAFLCAELKIDNTTISNSAAYLKSWMKALQNDKTLLIKASSKAQKAVNYIKNL